MGNTKNAAIALVTPLPSILFYIVFLKNPDFFPSQLQKFCENSPFLLANILFFLNINVLFWVIGILLCNHWMIDLYWTIIPILLSHYFKTHPLAESNELRSKVSIILMWTWSVRLTHSYFRREKWEWGKREDWRFNEMREKYGKHWWWISFFAVYVSQQIFLMGICLPMYAIHSSNKSWDTWDSIATFTCMTGIVIAYFADTQLYEFVQNNESLKEKGEPVILTLDKGLWGYSRHPNYVGEQLWWWGLFIFAWNVGQGWMFVGPLVNTLCLAYVTILVENRMLRTEYRAEAYRKYQKSTSVWIPWFRFSTGVSKQKKR